MISNLKTNVAPREARGPRLELRDLLVDRGKFCETGRSENTMLILLVRVRVKVIKTFYQNLVGQDHRVEADVGRRVLLKPVVVGDKVRVVGDPKAEGIVLGGVAQDANYREASSQNTGEHNFYRMSGHLPQKESLSLSTYFQNHLK